MLCYAVLCCELLCCTILCCAVLCSNISGCMIMCCAVLCSVARVWGALYAAADCASQSLVLDTTVPYGDCIGGALPDGTKVCMYPIPCHAMPCHALFSDGLYEWRPITDHRVWIFSVPLSFSLQ
jgi:hypothetical protein